MPNEFITIKIRRETLDKVTDGLLAEQQRTRNPKLSQAAFIDRVVDAGIDAITKKAKRGASDD